MTIYWPTTVCVRIGDAIRVTDQVVDHEVVATVRFMIGRRLERCARCDIDAPAIAERQLLDLEPDTLVRLAGRTVSIGDQNCLDDENPQYMPRGWRLVADQHGTKRELCGDCALIVTTAVAVAMEKP